MLGLIVSMSTQQSIYDALQIVCEIGEECFEISKFFLFEAGFYFEVIRSDVLP